MTGVRPARRVDLVAEEAFVRRVDHVLCSAEMVGRVVLEVRIVEAADTAGNPDGTVRLSRRLAGEHVELPSFITAESVEAAQHGAYDRVIEELARTLVDGAAPRRATGAAARRAQQGERLLRTGSRGSS